MKKLIAGALMVGMLVVPAMAQDVSVYLNNQKMLFDQNPIIENGRTLVPLRSIFEGLGAEVKWNAEKEEITGTTEDKEIILRIGDTKATVNGKAVNLDVAAKIENGRTLVPLRFISESLDAEVKWNADTYRIDIKKGRENSQADYKSIEINKKTYYQRLTNNTWDGEYYQAKYYTGTYNNTSKVVSYDEYLECINKINEITKDKISNYYTDKNSNYIVLSYADGHRDCGMNLINCIEDGNKIVVYGDETQYGLAADGFGYFVAIPTNMPVGTTLEYRECYSRAEINNIRDHGNPYDEIQIAYKPIIYLYPTKETKLNVKLGNADLAFCVYPEYNAEKGWSVLAKPNGDLVDLTTNRNLYALYYESKNIENYKVEKEGFVVEGKDIAKFLEEKLEILGLTEREAQEFIIYWLPVLQENKYNYIRFATMEEIAKNMPLEINPNPDTIIRVLMTFKGLEKPIEVEEQKLTTPERSGFVAVEWGGSEIK